MRPDVVHHQHQSLLTKIALSIWVVVIYSTHTFFYIIRFTIWVNTFKENCCCFITTACLSCKLITRLVTNRALYLCVRFHFSLLCRNTLILNNILFKIFIDELLNFRVIWHTTINTYKKYYHLFIITKAYKDYKYDYFLWQLFNFTSLSKY